MESVSALDRFVAKLRLRSALSNEEADAIRGLTGDELSSRARHVIVRPGEEVDAACLVVRGLIGRFDQLPDGTRQITHLYLPGDMCDLHSVAIPCGWSGLQALCAAVTLGIPHPQLRKLAVAYPGVAMAFWRETVADASILAKSLSVLGRRRALARVAHLLCDVGARMELAHLGLRTQFSLPISQAQLADVLGLTLTHVHSCLRGLERQGKLHRQGSEIHILDLPYLVDCAQFDERYLLARPNGDSPP